MEGMEGMANGPIKHSMENNGQRSLPETPRRRDALRKRRFRAANVHFTSTATAARQRQLAAPPRRRSRRGEKMPSRPLASSVTHRQTAR